MKTMLCGVPRAMLMATALCATLGLAHAAPINVPIVSGALWKSSDAVPAGWQDVGFDDSAWSAARAPYPNPVTSPQDLAGGPTNAELMWHYPLGTPDGLDGPVQAWFRYSFHLSLTPSNLPVVGQALILADDDFELYINGQQYMFSVPTSVSANGNNPLFIDFTAMLLNGDNVIAIHAVDNSLQNPADLLFEWVYFDGLIQSVPEPASLALLFPALGGMLLARRRRPR